MIPDLHSFTNKERTQRIDQAVSTHYDLIIIGGGITGAGIILDATLRGLKVLLLEKEDFASGTSSKSTKLIHGGLRYLKQLEFGLVKESGVERAIVHNMACHLVHPRNMVLPIVHDGTFSKLSASIAISVYDRLAKVQGDQRRKNVSKRKLLSIEPSLRKERVKSGIIYSEYRTDDARLTMELIKASIRNGAEAFNYAEVTGFEYENGKTAGVIAHDHISNKEIKLSSAIVVSAAGPWVDFVRTKDDAQTETNLHLSKGVHIVLEKSLLPIKNPIYFDAFDGRMIFAIPRGQVVYVGTTDTTYKGHPDAQHCTLQDAEYLINATNNFFDIHPITVQDIKSTWSGLRPLIQQKGKPPTELSRKDEIFVSDSGLISIAGGKLTGFRKMAQRIVDLVFEKNDKEWANCKTKNYKLHHAPFKNYSAYRSWTQNLIAENDHLNRNEIISLVNNYGKDAEKIIKYAQDNNGNILESELEYTIEHESVFHPLDFFERRTGYLYFDIDKMRSHYENINSKLGNIFSHSSKLIDQQKEDCQEALDANSLKLMLANADYK